MVFPVDVKGYVEVNMQKTHANWDTEHPILKETLIKCYTLDAPSDFMLKFKCDYASTNAMDF